MAETEVISLGRLEEYNSVVPWSIYVEKIDFYFAANNIKDADKKKNILLSSVGTATFSILRDIIVPTSLKEIKYDDLLKKAKEHFSPCPSEIVERFKFQKRLRKQGESIANFVRDLRRLSEYCNFETTLNDRLRDQLVFGIQDEKIQQKLLNTKNLTFQTAVEIAESFETAEAGVKSLQINGGTTVNKVQDARMEKTKVYQYSSKPKEGMDAPGNRNSYKDKPCYRCARNHKPVECPFKSTECHACHKVGHLKICCRNRNFSTVNQKLKKNSKIKTVQEYSLNVMRDECNNVLWEKEVTINGIKVNFEIDSGAAHTIVSKKIADKLFSAQWEALKKRHKDELAHEAVVNRRNLEPLRIKFDKELEELKKFQEEELNHYDMKIILELDQVVSDQQNTLDRAGVPGFILSNKEFDIKLQMYLLGFISELSRREEMEKNSL